MEPRRTTTGYASDNREDVGLAPPDDGSTRAPATALPTRRSGDEALHLLPWWESELALAGHLPTDPYVERFWLPVMGPAATLALRRIAADLRRRPTGYSVGVADLARSLGLGRGTGRNAPVARAIDRLGHFGLARRTGGGVMVRTHVPDLPEHLSRRLPRWLREEHAVLMADCDERVSS